MLKRQKDIATISLYIEEISFNSYIENRLKGSKINTLLFKTQSEPTVKITIKHLPTHEVFKALYNYIAITTTAETINPITDEQATHIIQTYKNSTLPFGPLYFNTFDAEAFLKPDAAHEPRVCTMNIDLSFSIICTDGFDAIHGPGVCEAIINELRVSIIARLKQELCYIIPPNEDIGFSNVAWRAEQRIPIERSIEGRLLVRDQFRNTPQYNEMQTKAEMLAELELAVEQYERLKVFQPVANPKESYLVESLERVVSLDVKVSTNPTPIKYVHNLHVAFFNTPNERAEGTALLNAEEQRILQESTQLQHEIGAREAASESPGGPAANENVPRGSQSPSPYPSP